jgi:hypothetical protein
MGRQDGSDWFRCRSHIARDDHVCPDPLANWLALWMTGMAICRSNGMSASRNYAISTGHNPTQVTPVPCADLPQWQSLSLVRSVPPQGAYAELLWPTVALPCFLRVEIKQAVNGTGAKPVPGRLCDNSAVNTEASTSSVMYCSTPRPHRTETTERAPRNHQGHRVRWPPTEFASQRCACGERAILTRRKKGEGHGGPQESERFFGLGVIPGSGTIDPPACTLDMPAPAKGGGGNDDVVVTDGSIIPRLGIRRTNFLSA